MVVVAGCHKEPTIPTQVVMVNAAPSAQNAPMPTAITPGFVHLAPRGGPARSSRAPGPKCEVSEYILGKLVNPNGDLFPVRLAADSSGAIVAWNGPDGLQMRRLDASGKPTGVSARQILDADETPMILLVPQEGIAPDLATRTPPEFAFVRSGLREFHIAWMEWATLKVSHERTVPRPQEMGSVLEAVLYEEDVWLIGELERRITFLRIGKGGTPQTKSVVGPKVPVDQRNTVGLWNGDVAMAISTIRGELFLATQERIDIITPDVLRPEKNVFVRPHVVQFGGGITYGLQTYSHYPLSRSEDATLLDEKPDTAFRVECNYGFPSEGWTGSHFLFACAMGDENLWNTAVYRVDCRKN